MTIHRLVEWLPGEGPLRSSGYPLECDLLVVDESSMLSLEVAAMLLDAVADGTHVVLIGDADQLPPVGAGKPFADLIESDSVPVARLTHVFRQAARSLIVQAAHAINAGGRPRTQRGRGRAARLLLHRAGLRRGRGRRDRGAGVPSGCPRTTAWTPSARSRCCRPCTAARWASTP